MVIRKIFIISICVCLVNAMSFAQEAKTNGFQNTLSAGIALTDGNSKTLQSNVNILTEGEKKDLGSVRAGLEANYGESTVNSNKETTVKNIRAFTNVKKTITPLSFVSINVDALHDDIAQVNYRTTLGPALGAYLIKNDTTSISLELGPSYIWEEVTDINDDYLVIRIGERFEHNISKTAKVWQSLEYLPKADDFGDNIVNTEFGTEATMTAKISLRIVLQNKYDSTPGEGLEENDISLISGISVSL